MATKSKDKSKGIPNTGELKKCKHCSYSLNKSDIKKLPRKKLSARYGTLWTGIEYPYIQIYKVTCPNLSCGKKYSHKHKGATWFYK